MVKKSSCSQMCNAIAMLLAQTPKDRTNVVVVFLCRHLPPSTVASHQDHLPRPQLVLDEDLYKPSCSNAKHNFVLQRQNEFEESHNNTANYHHYDDYCLDQHFGRTMSPNELYQQFQQYPSDDHHQHNAIVPRAPAPLIPTHKKLNRAGNNTLVVNPMCNRQPGQLALEPYQGQPSMLNTRVTMGMNKPKITIERAEDDEHDTNRTNDNQEANIFSRQAHRDRAAAAYRSQSVEDPSTLINNFFGHGGQTQTCFNTLLTCFKPFWDIIGTKGSEDNGNTDWEIPFGQIKDLQWLGSGAQGAVFMGKHTRRLPRRC